MIETEQEEFDKKSNRAKNLKLLVDFEVSDYNKENNQMLISDIKYKRKKKKQEDVNLREKNKKNSNNLF